MDNNINLETEQTETHAAPKVRFAAGAIFLLMFTITLTHLAFIGTVSAFNVMFTAAHLILAIVTLLKLRGTPLAVALSLLVFTSTLNASDYSLLYMIQSFANITVWGSLLFCTLPECGAKELSKYKIICSAIFYVAVIIETVTRFILYIIPLFSLDIPDSFSFVYLSLFVLVSSNVLFVLSTLLMAKWIFDPYERTHESVGPCNSAWVSERKGMPIGKHIALLLFTFGIWLWMWVYQTTKYTNSVKDEPLRSPRSQLLLYIFLPFYPIYWSYKTVKRLHKLQDNLAPDFSALCVASSIFVPLLNVILIQNAINPQTNDNMHSLKSPYVEFFAAKAAAEAEKAREEALRAEKARIEAEEMKAKAEAEAKKAEEEAEALNAVPVISEETPTVEAPEEDTAETAPEDTETVTEEPSNESTEETTEEEPTESIPEDTEEVTEDPSVESTVEAPEEDTTETAPDDTEEVTEEPSDESTEETTEEEPTETVPEDTEEVTEEPSYESTEETTEKEPTETAPEDTEEVTEEPSVESSEETTEEEPTESIPDDTEEVTEEPPVESTKETTEEEPIETVPEDTEAVTEAPSDESTDVTKTENTTI